MGIALVFGGWELLAGIAILRGRAWGKTVGVVIATLNAINHLLYLPAYPLWSILIMIVDFIIIYALSVHRRPAYE